MMRLEKRLLDLEMISDELNYWMTMTGTYVLQSLCLETIDTGEYYLDRIFKDTWTWNFVYENSGKRLRNKMDKMRKERNGE